jgi:hypothetical protein
MKIGPMIQNPGWVLCHIFMVGLLSQVMDSDGDSEHNEDGIELPRAHNCEVVDNVDELPFCVPQKGQKGEMHEEAEKRDVVDDITLEGEHNDEKMVETQEHEKPEKRDSISSSSSTYHTTRPPQSVASCRLSARHILKRHI